jgi:hypothetical protein
MEAVVVYPRDFPDMMVDMRKTTKISLRIFGVCREHYQSISEFKSRALNV